MRTDKLRLLAAGTVLAAVAVTAADAVTVARPDRPAPAGRAAPEPVRPQAPPAAARPSVTPGQPSRSVPVDAPNGQVGVPDIALRAYRAAEQRTAVSRPGCHLSWSLVAAIGRVESNHARGGDVDGGGTSMSPIIGPQLNGNGYASISDTDNGVLDGDTDWDRAVGPMQFIPSTWRRNGVDGNADGVASPHNLFDAAGAAGRYLCAGGRDLTDPSQLSAAVFSYNPSQSYVEIVLSWQRAYASGITVLPPATLPIPPVASPAPAPVPAPGSQVPGPTTPPPGTDPAEPPTEDCLLDLAALGLGPEALLGIETEVACQEHLLLLELPLLGPILGG